MVNESDSNKLFITDLLLSHYQIIAETITDTCNLYNIEVSVVSNAKDYWCRDFMPLQVNKISLFSLYSTPLITSQKSTVTLKQI